MNGAGYAWVSVARRETPKTFLPDPWMTSSESSGADPVPVTVSIGTSTTLSQTTSSVALSSSLELSLPLLSTTTTTDDPAASTAATPSAAASSPPAPSSTGLGPETSGEPANSKPESGKGGSLSSGAIAGISVGSAVAVLGVAGLCLFFFLRGRKQGLAARDAAAAAAGESGSGEGTSGAGEGGEGEQGTGAAAQHGNELYGSSEIKEKPVELHSQSPSQELGSGVTRYEMGGGGHRWHDRVELP